MTIEEQRNAIIEDAKKALIEVFPFLEDEDMEISDKDAQFYKRLIELQAARNQSNNVPVAEVRYTSHPAKDHIIVWIGEEKPALGTQLYTSPQQSNALEMALERMDRARNILTDGKPTRECNWGMLDTSDLRALIPQPESTAPQQEIPNEMQEIANFKKWFQSVQGIEYQGMYTFAYDAWMARAKSAAQPESDGK
jgi:hypothetical protein